MTDETTQPPVRQPNTFRTWLPRIWKGTVGAIQASPDRALIVFLILFAAAAIL
jgi:hypothetical protein